jgi:hypothetical protein
MIGMECYIDKTRTSEDGNEVKSKTGDLVFMGDI